MKLPLLVGDDDKVVQKPRESDCSRGSGCSSIRTESMYSNVPTESEYSYSKYSVYY